MQATIDQQTQEKIKQVSEETGIPEPEVLDRALDMLLLTEEMHGLRDLKDDMDFWQQRYLDTLATEDERIATLEYDKGGHMTYGSLIFPRKADTCSVAYDPRLLSPTPPNPLPSLFLSLQHLRHSVSPTLFS